MCDTKESFLLNLTDSLNVQHFMESSIKKILPPTAHNPKDFTYEIFES